MSSYTSSSLSSYDPAIDSSSDDRRSSPATTPSTSPSTSPTSSTSPLAARKRPSTPPPIKTSFSSTSAPSTPSRPRPLVRDVCPHSEGFGVDPATLIGRTLVRVRRSRAHPCTTLHFSDGSAFQVRVVGYDPHYGGVPKVLESDSPVLNPRASSGSTDVRLVVSHAAAVTLSDKAFQSTEHGDDQGKGGGLGTDAREDRWTQRHAAFALKFEEERGWHCVWATMAEYDEKDSERCVFRNYADVYLDALAPHDDRDSPIGSSFPAAHSPTSATPPTTPRKAHRHKRRNPKHKPSIEETPKARW